MLGLRVGLCAKNAALKARHRISIHSPFPTIFIAMLMSAGSTASAQTPMPVNQVGLPSNGIFSGGSIDSVQLNNGNLHVDIPLLHLPGIGMDTDIHFIYDNKVWYFKNVQPASAAAYTYVYQTRGLWNYEDPLSGGITETSSSVYWTCNNTNGVSNNIWLTKVNYISYTDGDGTNHHFPSLTGAPTSESIQCSNIILPIPSTDYSGDSSGYQATTNSSGNVASITDKHGRKYIFNQTVLIPSATATSPSYFPVIVEDANGNRITSSTVTETSSPYQTTYTLTDTVSRVISEVSGSNCGSNQCKVITYSDQNGNLQTITINYVGVPISYSAICQADGQPVSVCSQYDSAGYSASVVTAVLPGSFVLQNGDTYTITYNSSGYGEIQSITLPTGGEISYTYGNWDDTGEQVLSRTVTENGVSSVWNYNYTPVSNERGILYNDLSGEVSDITTVADPNLNNTVYTCTVYVPASLTSWSGLGTPPCYMTKEQIYSGSATSGALLATKTTGYTITGVIMPTSETFTWNATGQTSETDTQWDTGTNTSGTGNFSFGNVVSRTVHDFGGAILSNTKYSYLYNQNSAYYAANLLDRVTGISVYNSASSLVAQTTTAYDQFSLASTTGTTQHDYTNFSAARTLRGLPTSVTKYSGASSPSITTYAKYNDLGKPTQTTDGRGYSTTYAYGAQNAFLTATTMPPTSNGVAHTAATSYDVNTGLLLAQSDYNGNQTTYTYDSRMRSLVTTRPDGGTTANSYPSSNEVISAVSESPSPTKVTTATLDGLGRTISVSTAADTACGALTVNTTYDAVGSVSAVSNPHCVSSQSTDGWTQYAYDAVGRVITKTNQDGTTQSSSYNGSTITFNDETGRQWQRTYNASGWLTKVLEPNGTMSIGSAPTLETDYAYDALGNLLRVDQWGGPSGSIGDHVRKFAYDSISRLIASNNPESASAAIPASQSCTGASGVWTTCYSYDNNGNLIRKTDNRGTSITYAYNALNRVLSKTYSDSTPTASFTYDISSVSGSGNDIGEMTQATIATGSTTLATTSTYAYDPMGRLAAEQQCTPANCGSSAYNLSYTYDKGGKTLSATFPSDAPTAGTTTPASQPVTLSYAYDNAERLLTAGSTWNASTDTTHPATLFQVSTGSNPLGYGPMGLQNASLGINSSYGTTIATLQRGYDNRGRVVFEADGTGGAISSGSSSSGSFTISGAEEQVTKTSTRGTAAFSISGYENAHQGGCIQYWPSPSTTCKTYQVIPDVSSIEVVVTTPTGAITATGSYGIGSTTTTVAQSIASSFTSKGFPATVGGTYDNVVTVQANTTGLSSNYSYAANVGGGDSDFYVSSLSGNSVGNYITSGAFTGGWDEGTYYDTGTINVTVSDTTAQVNWGEGSTPSGLAATLATSINALEGISGSSCPNASQIATATGFATACASGATVTLTSLNGGPAVDWAVTVSATDTNPTYFSASGPNKYSGSPSFAVTATNMTGGETTGNALYSYMIPDAGGYAPNGNLLKVADTVTGTWSYAYDNLNRVVNATASDGHYEGAQTAWSYDTFGNRTSETESGTAAVTMPASSAASYTAATNQVSASSQNGGAALAYDAAGNVTYDGLNSYLYDAEGRLCAVKNYVGSLIGYVYDASGTRVAKGTLTSFTCNFAPSNFTPTTSWVLGPGGEQVTEYSVNGGASTWVHTNAFAAGKLLATYEGTDTYFALEDWLGTKRAEVSAGGCFSTFASLPFGNGLSASGNCPDATEHHYTGKERDSESGNDYFGARYYASSMGRFMSPDWSAKEEPVPYAKLDDPQSLNLYAYVRNNPLGAVDSDGHVVVEKATTYVPYPVSGATASEALDQANSHFTGPDGQGYAGMTTPSLSVSWSSEPSGTLANGSATVTQTITSDTVTVGNTVQLPEWTGSAQASPAERDAFNTAVGQLKDHENQHVSDNRAAANALDKSLPGTKATATASTVQAASRAAGAKVQTKVDAKVAGATADITNRAATLDKNTNHGVKLQ